MAYASAPGVVRVQGRKQSYTERELDEKVKEKIKEHNWTKEEINRLRRSALEKLEGSKINLESGSDETRKRINESYGIDAPEAIKRIAKIQKYVKEYGIEKALENFEYIDKNEPPIEAYTVNVEGEEVKIKIGENQT